MVGRVVDLALLVALAAGAVRLTYLGLALLLAIMRRSVAKRRSKGGPFG